MYYKSVNVQGQGHSVKTSSDRQITALFQEIGVAESNGDVKMLTRITEIAVCAHAQYKTGKKQPRTTGATPDGLQFAMHSQLLPFPVFFLCDNVCG